jgi:hypothetical protein
LVWAIGSPNRLCQTVSLTLRVDAIEWTALLKAGIPGRAEQPQMPFSSTLSTNHDQHLFIVDDDV